MKLITNQFSYTDVGFLEEETEDEDSTFDLSENDADTDTDTAEDANQKDANEVNQHFIAPAPQIKPAQKRKQNSTLLKKTTSFTYQHAKIDELILESKTLNINRHKHSAILLSRTLIQVVLSYIIKNSSQHQNYKIEAKHNYLELDTLLVYFSNNIKNIFPDEQDKNAYKLIRSDLNSYKDSGKLISNLVTHSDAHTLTLQEVTNVQVKLQSLMDYFLNKIISGHQAK